VVQSFLNTVQPKPFPQADLILKLIQSVDQRQTQALIKEALIYQIGFLVCAIIGVLYIVLMPIVGLFLACCRCCGNCGGKMYQKQTSSTHCRRRTLYWGLFLTTIIILIGNATMFYGNEALKTNVKQSPLELNKTINNIRIFLSSVPQQFNHVVNESYRTIDEVKRNLDGRGRGELGRKIRTRLEETVGSVLTSIRFLDNVATTQTRNQLNTLNASISQLQSSLNLGLDLTEFQGALDKVISSNLTSTINEVSANHTEPFFPSSCDRNFTHSHQTQNTDHGFYLFVLTTSAVCLCIPQRVANDTGAVVLQSKSQLDNLKTEISQFAKDVPLTVLSDILTSVDQVQNTILNVSPNVDFAEYIRWIVFLIVSCVVLLVVLCNLLGLVLGPLGLHPNVDPIDRSCTADCGGTFFMMSAGFSFLFSWLFMLIVLVLFLVGGNVYTLICQPWKSGELLQIIDSPGLIPGLQIGPALGLKDNLTVSEIYKGCEKNNPLWTTIRLYEVVNLNELLNVTKYSEQIQKNFEDTNITLSTITLLGPEEIRRLQSFSNTTKDVNFTEVTRQMSKLSSINLNTTADKLDKVAENLTNTGVRKELQNEAGDLRTIQRGIESTIHPQLEHISSIIASLQSAVGKMNKTVADVLGKVGAAQDFLSTNTSLIVKMESRGFLDCQLSYFTQYADWANLTITQQLGRCGPVVETVDSAAVVFCSQVVNSLNVFWFGLGWCLIFFIPSIIFSIKLAKYYRKMKYSDVHESEKSY
uniref:Prominin 2 n=1 Tax=Tetraodon nigroviridis TaxID=99883 RepID=H3C2H3_TETNG